MSESHHAAVVLAMEPAKVPAATSLPPAVEVPAPSPAVEVHGPPSTTEVAESSSARDSLTVEEMMDLEMCQYIDFPGVGVINLEAPQLPEKEYEVVAERRPNKPTIMETIVSVSKALQEYKHAGGFASGAAADVEDVAPVAPAAHEGPREMCPHHRVSIKVGRRRLPDRWKPP
jgi:hypothetical protein